MAFGVINEPAKSIFLNSGVSPVFVASEYECEHVTHPIFVCVLEYGLPLFTLPKDSTIIGNDFRFGEASRRDDSSTSSRQVVNNF